MHFSTTGRARYTRLNLRRPVIKMLSSISLDDILHSLLQLHLTSLQGQYYVAQQKSAINV